MAKLHAPHPDPMQAAPPLCLSACGRPGTHADDPDAVECLDCRRLLQRAGQARAAAEHVPEYGVEVPARFGARELSATARRAVVASHTERSERPRRWPSADAAARAYFRAVVEGASLRSTTDPDRANRVQTSSDPSLGGREHDAVERNATTARALWWAQWAPELAAVCGDLEPQQALAVYAIVVAGKPVQAHTGPQSAPLKGRYTKWVSVSPEQVADDLGDGWTREAVFDLCRHFRYAVQDALLASGELGRRTEAGPAPRRGSFADNPLGRLG